MFLEFLGQNLAFDSADSDTDATVMCSGVVWSCPLVFRGADVDHPSEFLILTINCTALIIRYWLFPQNWWYQFFHLGGTWYLMSWYRYQRPPCHPLYLPHRAEYVTLIVELRQGMSICDIFISTHS